VGDPDNFHREHVRAPSTDTLEHRGLPEDAVSRCVLRREHERINYSVDVAQEFRLIFLTLVTCERFLALKWGSSVTVVVTGATVYEGKCCMLGTWSIRMIVLGVPIISYVQSLNSTHDISLQISGISRAARSWSKLIGTPVEFLISGTRKNTAVLIHCRVGFSFVVDEYEEILMRFFRSFYVIALCHACRADRRWLSLYSLAATFAGRWSIFRGNGLVTRVQCVKKLIIVIIYNLISVFLLFFFNLI
jgi:hypothetical protein